MRFLDFKQNKIFALCLCMVLILLTGIHCKSFATPKLSSWATEHYNAMISKDVLPESFKDDSTNMQQNITREEFAEIVARYYLYYNPQDVKSKEVFKDTDNKYVQLAGGLELVNGVEKGVFNPSGLLTRQEAAVMFDRAEKKVSNLTENFTTNVFMQWRDFKSVSNWAFAGVFNMSGRKYITGYDDLTFRPLGNMTREQAVTVVARMIDSKVTMTEDDGVTYNANGIPKEDLKFLPVEEAFAKIGYTYAQGIANYKANYAGGIAIVQAKGNKVNIPIDENGGLTEFNIYRVKAKALAEGGYMSDTFTFIGYGKTAKNGNRIDSYLDINMITTDNNIINLNFSTLPENEAGYFSKRPKQEYFEAPLKKVQEYKGFIIRIGKSMERVNGEPVWTSGRCIMVLYDKPTSLGEPSDTWKSHYNNW